MTSVAEKLGTYKNPPKGKGKPEPLFTLWQKIRAEQTGEYQVPMTMKDKGQLKKFGEFCPEGKSEDVVKSILGEWHLFVNHVKSASGLVTVPAQPKVGFALKHVGLAVQFWEQSCGGGSAQAGTQEIGTQENAGVVMSPAEKKPKEKKLTFEEMQAILEEDESE